jgi:hypothetical protein
MRLIDADNIKMPKDASYKAAVKRIVAVQPTAYNSDKVAERLEDHLFEKYYIEGDNKILEIVEGGGKDEKTK